MQKLEFSDCPILISAGPKCKMQNEQSPAIHGQFRKALGTPFARIGTGFGPQNGKSPVECWSIGVMDLWQNRVNNNLISLD
jgi:hypothetical protein